MENNAYSLGLVSISFRSHTPAGIIKAAKDAGLDFIEWGSDVHAPCADTARLDGIVRLQNEYGIKCSSYGTYFRLGRSPLSELSDCISAAKTLGTDTLRIWCGDKSGADMTDDEKTYLYGECRKAAETAKKHGVTLCTERHLFTYAERTGELLQLLNSVNSPHFRTYWQPFQNADEDENYAAAKILSPYVTNVHVFNWRGGARFPLEEAAGAWKRYLSVLPPPRKLLLEFMPDDRLETLSREADALMRIVGDMK